MQLSGGSRLFCKILQYIEQACSKRIKGSCIGGIEDLSKTEMEKEKEFAQTIPAADVWSVDKYMALHWGWPYDVAREAELHINGIP